MSKATKIWLALAAAFILIGLSFAMNVKAHQDEQTNWVVCENIANGVRQSFPNRCPSGLVFVSY